MKKSIFFTILVLFLVVLIILLVNNTYTSLALSKYGSRGEEVRQIQTKLKRWGYYNGSIDGIYEFTLS